jgi:SAM-dependent methyltransferase
MNPIKRLIKPIIPTILLNIIRHLWLEKPASTEYEIITETIAKELTLGWTATEIPLKQQQAFAPLLQQMYAGQPRADFLALVEAIRFITSQGTANPLIIEAGCGTGWNQEILNHLWQPNFRYIGLDYSATMIVLAKQLYSAIPFTVGDAMKLPFHDQACDIFISGTVLMHLLGYQQAIQESSRVARQWCIFHTVPILQNRPTTILRKKAYGQPTLEVIFNEQELMTLFNQNGFVVRQIFDSFPYNLELLLHEPTFNKTYLCEKIA